MTRGEKAIVPFPLITDVIASTYLLASPTFRFAF